MSGDEAIYPEFASKQPGVVRDMVGLGRSEPGHQVTDTDVGDRCLGLTRLACFCILANFHTKKLRF